MEIFAHHTESIHAVKLSTDNITQDNLNYKNYTMDNNQTTLIATSRDASVNFFISEDFMSVYISQYSPPVGNGKPLSMEFILDQLQESGVITGLNLDEIQRACELLQAGGAVQGMIIAQGRPSIEPRDAKIDFAGDLSFPVLPGMRIGRVRPPVKAAKGMTVDGREILPLSGEMPKRITVGDNIKLDQQNFVLKADTYGLVRLVEWEIRVEPLLIISPDHHSVSATLYHVDYSGTPLNMPTIEEELKRLGVVSKPLEMNIQSALTEAASTKIPQDVVIVEGTAPTPGTDGWLELLVKVREKSPIEVDGKIDYSERGSFPSVEEDMTVALLHPPTTGTPGMDVYGRLRPAKGGRPANASVGRSLELLPDGISYRAIVSGVLLFEKNVLHVVECLEVGRDVSFATGNIRVERGSIKIRGAVSKGFQVEAPGHVIVQDVIESARVEAGKDIHVQGGLLMPGGGIVKSGGSVVAQYAINARIQAGGDVIIANEVSNSTIKAGGKFIATRGLGIVQGCEIVCGAGACVNELGSVIGAYTSVSVSAKDTVHSDLLREKSKLRRRVRRVNELVGVSDPKTILTRTPVARRQAVAELLKARIRDQARLGEIAAILDEEKEQRLKTLEAARIVVKGAVYPGVVIKFGGRVLRVADSVTNATFFFERNGQGVSVTSN